MNNERFTIPELLFHPSDINIEEMGIPEAIVHSIESCASGNFIYATLSCHICLPIFLLLFLFYFVEFRNQASFIQLYITNRWKCAYARFQRTSVYT
jgi:hypothetical protein